MCKKNDETTNEDIVEGTVEGTVAEAIETTVEHMVNEHAADKDSVNENEDAGKVTAVSEDKVRPRDIVIFTLGALLICVLFPVLVYLLGELAVFLEKNGDISWFFTAA